MFGVSGVSWVGLQMLGACGRVLTRLWAEYRPTNRPRGQGGTNPHRELSNPGTTEAVTQGRTSPQEKNRVRPVRFLIAANSDANKSNSDRHLMKKAC